MVNKSLFLFLILSLVLEAKWSRGDSKRPANAQKITVTFHVNDFKLDLIKTALQSYNISAK